MATAIYTVTITGPRADMSSGSVTSATITRTGGIKPPANAYVTDATATVANYYCYTSRSPYLTFNNALSVGTYFGYTDGLPRHTDALGVETIPCFISDGILGVDDTAYAGVGVQGGGTGRQIGIRENTTITITVEYEVRISASWASFNEEAYAGSDILVSINNEKLAQLRHKVTISLGGYSVSGDAEVGIGTVSIPIPMDFLYAIPNTLRGVGSMEVETYNGDAQVGTNHYIVYINVPDDVAPKAGSLLISKVNNMVPSSWGIYVQNKSGVTIAVPNAVGAYGSTITKYTISGGMAETRSTGSFTLSPIPTFGTLSFMVTVTDSRGRTESVSSSIEVEEYSPPAISESSVKRCVNTGEETEEGTYIAATVTADVSACAGNNGHIIRAYYRANGSDTWTAGPSLTSGIKEVFGDGTINADSSYQVRIVLSDQFTSVEKIFEVGAYSYAIHFKRGGLGVAFGQSSKTDRAVEISPDWTLLHGGADVLEMLYKLSKMIIYSASEPEDAQEGQIWLKPIDGFTYTVDTVEGATGYTFELNEDGWYESTNKGIANSYAICRVNFHLPVSTDIIFDVVNFAESIYDYGMFGNLDSPLLLSHTEDADLKKSFSGEHSESAVQQVYSNVSAGDHFIDIKYIKDSIQNKNNDSLRFKVVT